MPDASSGGCFLISTQHCFVRIVALANVLPVVSAVSLHRGQWALIGGALPELHHGRTKIHRENNAKGYEGAI